MLNQAIARDPSFFAAQCRLAEAHDSLYNLNDYASAICILALIDARLGRKEEALREIRRAAELIPIEKDSLNGTDMIAYSAIVAAWVGERDLALQNLAKIVQMPGFDSYGRLKLMPWYDPLRGDARFDEIVASLAPKP